ncbi:MAG: glycoside hydrolase family 2 TIM barrel-domain containing protein [Clostridia bacterium]
MREIFNMNFDWDFHDGDIKSPNFKSVHATFENPAFMKAGNCGIAVVGYNLKQWKKVQLPHDLRIEKAVYDNEVPGSQGFLATGLAWYRKEFFIDKKYEGCSITLQFDGVFRDSEVYVNGYYVGNHLSGYTSFEYEISDFLLYGQNNAIAVKVDGTIFEGWWYEAAGIYRDVHLCVSDTLKVKYDGVFVTSETDLKNASVCVAVELENESEKAGTATVCAKILDPNGDEVATCSTETEIKAYKETKVDLACEIADVKLWSLEQTNQYTAEITVTYGGKVADTYNQKFGVRTIEYSPEFGIILNGERVKIKGVCVHDDFAGVGGAMSRDVIRHKIFLLKQWGCTGYRSSHNPPSPYLLEACDDFGILVMDEVRLMSTSKEYLGQMTDLIRRDRNHPSVFLWSIGNEEMAVHGTKTGVKIINHLLRVAHELDSTRLCTYANNCNWKEITIFHEENGLHMDVFGFNYHCLRNFEYYADIHEKYPDRCIIGTENASTLTTRGQYFPREEEKDMSYFSPGAERITVWSNPERKYNVSAYSETYPTWGANPLETMAAADPDYVSGYFIWTGFDYRGELMPMGWPSTVSRFGVIDLCGFTKEPGHHYRVKWAKEPTVYVYPHWNFPEDIGTVQVDVISNTDEVELFVNGVSQGRHVSPLRELVKYNVPYVAGEITAVAYNDGKEVARMTNKTASKPVKVNLEIVQDRPYTANGEDNIFVKVDLLDENGVHCPTADNQIHFDVTGAGAFLGGGNGDPLSMEDDKLPQRKLFGGLALAILRTKRGDCGNITLTATSEGLESATLTIAVEKELTDVLVSAPISAEAVAEREKDDADGAF